MDESRLEAMEQKLDAVIDAIRAAADEDFFKEFDDKYASRINAIGDKRKAALGDDWNELEGVHNFVRDKRHDPDYDVDGEVTGYIEDMEKRLEIVAEAADTPEEKEAVVEATEAVAEAEASGTPEAEAAAEEAVTEAEEVVDAGEGEQSPEDAEVEAALLEDPMLAKGLE